METAPGEERRNETGHLQDKNSFSAHHHHHQLLLSKSYEQMDRYRKFILKRQEFWITYHTQPTNEFQLFPTIPDELEEIKK